MLDNHIGSPGIDRIFECWTDVGLHVRQVLDFKIFKTLSAKVREVVSSIPILEDNITTSVCNSVDKVKKKIEVDKCKIHATNKTYKLRRITVSISRPRKLYFATFRVNTEVGIHSVTSASITLLWMFKTTQNSLWKSKK